MVPLMADLPFQNREDAARTLAKRLQQYSGKKNTLILALVRGGVVIGRTMADELMLPLYPYVVRKLGHPLHREFGLGAIAEGGVTRLDDAEMQLHGVSWEEMEPVIEEETLELARRKETYLVRARPDLSGKTIILTDDGAATGMTLIAAIEDLRKANVKKIVAAVPVCPPETADLLRAKADTLVVLATPKSFDAVGKWYEEFPQVEDNEVISILASVRPKITRVHHIS